MRLRSYFQRVKKAKSLGRRLARVTQLEQLEDRRMLTAAPEGEWHYAHPETASGDYVLRVAGNSLQIVSEVTESIYATVNREGLDRIVIEGSAQDDNLIVDFTNGNPIPAGGLVYDGGDQVHGDAMEFRNQDVHRAPLESINYTFWNETDGHIQLAGVGDVTFIGLEPIIDNLDAVDRTFDFTAGDDIIRLFDDGDTNNNMTVVDSNLAEAVTFTTPTNSLTFNSGEGRNIIVLESIDQQFEIPTFNINGGADIDELFMQVGPANTEINMAMLGGNDSVIIEATGNGSTTNVDLGSGSDRASISQSSAPASSLDNILGDVNVVGGTDDGSPTTVSVVAEATAKESSIAESVELQIDTGDVLEVVDTAATDDHIFVVSADSIQRITGSGARVSFDEVEDVQLLTGDGSDAITVSGSTQAKVQLSTGQGNDLLRVLGTANDSWLDANLGAGMDDVTLSTTGVNSITTIATGDDSDTVEFVGTGFMSAVSVDTGSGSDDILVTSTGAETANVVMTGDSPDDVEIRSSGGRSVLQVDTGSGADNVLMSGSGDETGVAIDANVGTDVITLAGSGDDAILDIDAGGGIDIINVQATGMGSMAEILSGPKSDTVNLSSDASANQGTLDQLLGSICIDGGDHDLGTLSEEVVASNISVKSGSFSRDAEIAVTSVEGDVLNIADQQTMAMGYVLSNSTPGTMALSRTSGVLDLDFGQFEHVNITTGSDADELVVAGTVEATHVTVDTQDGDDTLSVISTGTASFLAVDLGDGANMASIGFSGNNAIVRLESGAGDDEFRVTSTGFQSGLDVDTGDGSDTVMLVGAGSQGVVRIATGLGADTIGLQATPDASNVSIDAGAGLDIIDVLAMGENQGLAIDSGPGIDIITVEGTAAGAGLSVNAGSNNDFIHIRATEASSVTDVLGGEGADEINLFSNGGEAPATLDALQGEICVDGGGHPMRESPLLTIRTSVDVKEGQFSSDIQVSATDQDGDRLIVLDHIEMAASYVLSPTGLTRSADSKMAVINYVGIEQLHAESGNAGNEWDVSIGSGIKATVVTGDGDDTLNVSATEDATGGVLDLDVGMGNDLVSIESTGEESLTFLRTGVGDDSVGVNATGLGSGLQIDTADGQDSVRISSTGERSVLTLAMGLNNDNFSLEASGDRSLVDVSTDQGVDTASITSLGSESGITMDLGANADTLLVTGTGDAGGVRVDGGDDEDIFQVRATSIDSVTELLGGNGVDQFTIGSQSNQLDQIRGEICIDGGSNPMSATPMSISQQVTVRPGEDDEYDRFNEVNVDVQVGDQLTLLDSGNAEDRNYIVTSSSISIVGLEELPTRVSFDAIEGVQLDTGSGADGMTITGTPGSMNISTGDGVDTIRIIDPTDGAHLTLDTGAGADDINASLSGVGSIFDLNTGDGPDLVVATGFGFSSGANIHTESGDDEILLSSTPNSGVLKLDAGNGDDTIDLLATTDDSLTMIHARGGADAIVVNQSGPGSGAIIRGGSGPDQVNIEALASDGGLSVAGNADRDTVSTSSSVLAGSSEIIGETDPLIDSTTSNILELTDAVEALNLSDIPTEFVFHFDTLSLAADSATSIILDQAAVESFGMSPVRVLGGPEDTVELADGWSLVGTGFEGDEFFNQIMDGAAEVMLFGFNPWQQPVNRFDIDNNDAIGPVDALLLISQLGVREQLPKPVPGDAPDLVDIFHYDVNGDGALGPVDPLLVIGELPVTSGGSSLRAPLAAVAVFPRPSDIDTYFADHDEDED